MPSEDEIRSTHARIAALARVAKEPSGAAMLKAANKAFEESFKLGHQCKVCPLIEIDQSLPEKERARMAGAARTLHYKRISLRAGVARRRASAKAARVIADEAQAELADALAEHDDAV